MEQEKIIRCKCIQCDKDIPPGKAGRKCQECREAIESIKTLEETVKEFNESEVLNDFIKSGES